MTRRIQAACFLAVCKAVDVSSLDVMRSLMEAVCRICTSNGLRWEDRELTVRRPAVAGAAAETYLFLTGAPAHSAPMLSLHLKLDSVELPYGVFLLQPPATTFCRPWAFTQSSAHLALVRCSCPECVTGVALDSKQRSRRPLAVPGRIDMHNTESSSAFCSVLFPGNAACVTGTRGIITLPTLLVTAEQTGRRKARVCGAAFEVERALLR